jgi:hypothetical protein|nr:MAG TPA: hypothetical protein [Bacteriophage sp.]
MGRLIDPGVLLDNLSGMLSSMEDYDAIRKVVNNMPTAYDVDAVVEQLEELRELDACDFDNCPVEDIHCCDCTQKRMAERSIEIVKAGGKIELSEYSKSQGYRTGKQKATIETESKTE